MGNWLQRVEQLVIKPQAEHVGVKRRFVGGKNDVLAMCRHILFQRDAGPMQKAVQNAAFRSFVVSN